MDFFFLFHFDFLMAFTSVFCSSFYSTPDNIAVIKNLLRDVQYEVENSDLIIHSGFKICILPWISLFIIMFYLYLY